MKLTKEERFTLYCLMLAELEDRQSCGREIWMCHILDDLIDSARLYTDVYPQLTEFLKREPIGRIRLDGGWFSGYDFISRKRLLRSCINELGNELYSNN